MLTKYEKKKKKNVKVRGGEVEICQQSKCLLFISLHKKSNCAADCGEDCRLQSYCNMRKNLQIYAIIVL